MSNPFAVTTVKCAGPGCEHFRKECNHWFGITVLEASFYCHPLDPSDIESDEKPVCGQQCAQKLFEQFLSK